MGGKLLFHGPTAGPVRSCTAQPGRGKQPVVAADSSHGICLHCQGCCGLKDYVFCSSMSLRANPMTGRQILPGNPRHHPCWQLQAFRAQQESLRCPVLKWILECGSASLLPAYCGDNRGI